MKNFLERISNEFALHSYYTIRFIGLNIYPILTAIFGLAIVVCVPQLSEIIYSLYHAKASQKYAFALSQQIFSVVAIMTWAFSIWYSMRILNSTKYPNDPDIPEIVAPYLKELNAGAPRIAAYSVVLFIAMVFSIRLAQEPTLYEIFFNFACMILIREWVFIVGDRFVRLRVTDAKLFGSRYRISTWVAGMASSLLALMVLLRSTDIAAMEIFGCTVNPLGKILCPNIHQNIVPSLFPLTAILLIAFFNGKIFPLIISTALLGFSIYLESRGTALISIILIAISTIFFWWITTRRQILRLDMQVLEPGIPNAHVEKFTIWMIWLAIFCLLTLSILFSCFPLIMGDYLGTLATLFFALAFWCFFISFLFVFFRSVVVGDLGLWYL